MSPLPLQRRGDAACRSGSYAGCRRLSGHPALVAQRIEHLTTDQKVGGSSPSERARSEAPSDLGRGFLLTRVLTTATRAHYPAAFMIRAKTSAEWFANGEDVSPPRWRPAWWSILRPAADSLSGRNIDVSDGVAQMVARAAEIQEQDLYVMRQRE